MKETESRECLLRMLQHWVFFHAEMCWEEIVLSHVICRWTQSPQPFSHFSLVTQRSPWLFTELLGKSAVLPFFSHKWRRKKVLHNGMAFTAILPIEPKDQVPCDVKMHLSGEKKAGEKAFNSCLWWNVFLLTLTNIRVVFWDLK